MKADKQRERIRRVAERRLRHCESEIRRAVMELQSAGFRIQDAHDYAIQLLKIGKKNSL